MDITGNVGTGGMVSINLLGNIGMGGMNDVGGEAGVQDPPPSIDNNMNQAKVNGKKTAVGGVNVVGGTVHHNLGNGRPPIRVDLSRYFCARQKTNAKHGASWP